MRQTLQEGPLHARIIERFDAMSEQLQQAARHILEHPQEVALVSMRELARNAGVQPSTMTRLAKFLGFAGYEDLRGEHADVIRVNTDGFAARALQRQVGGANGESLAYRMLQGLSAQIARLCEPNTLLQLGAMAERLGKARRIYVLGLRSCHSVAWHFHYVMTLLGEKTVHLDGPAGTSGDALIRASSDDVLLAISINPYALQTLELAEAARDKGMEIVAITDSQVSPLVTIAKHVVLFPTESQTFFHTLTPALAVSEVLCGLLASQDRSAALEELKRADQHLSSMNTYATSIPRRKI
ncbi:MurR/RpiR family transcriptional regulator (plasmid) [Sinorhizobium meliloti]|uniref:MurR/RpiR family transcriptional regulator n=1 Tax=Rhizobium meliloti TaxID=382 RepID=UPI000B4A0760|nr:MurR/RpiR family transcriptional regulator [Sinorhizobium meliloti]ASP89524.1 MurR/RpiR family transcriptional regulator [Sinorhizobium meliloti]MQW30112.1 SIS domain-containing protein [Sinorhizobium meliloti]